jgi:hypothetical protein
MKSNSRGRPIDTYPLGYVADRLITPSIWIGAISVARRDVKANLSKIVKRRPDWKFA